MIELNLLPDVKQDYIKAERTRRLVISVSVILIIVSVGLLVLLFFAGALQKKHINDLSKDIDTYTKELKAKPKIGRILTVQNQLESLTDMHNSKPAVARLFDYLNQTTPTVVDISSLKVDFASNTITISGSADSLNAVNKYVDTLKYTNYTQPGSNASPRAFSNVVLTNFSVSGSGSGGATGSKPATYAINLNYDPLLFKITESVKLSVPSKATTRSFSDANSGNIFKESTKPTTQGTTR